MTDASDLGQEDHRRIVQICNKRGLHARAAAKFVKVAGQFDADVQVSRNGQTVSGRSIMGLMMLAAGPGCDLEIISSGPDASPSLDALAALVHGAFDEDE